MLEQYAETEQPIPKNYFRFHNCGIGPHYSTFDTDRNIVVVVDKADKQQAMSLFDNFEYVVIVGRMFSVYLGKHEVAATSGL